MINSTNIVIPERLQKSDFQYTPKRQRGVTQLLKDTFSDARSPDIKDIAHSVLSQGPINISPDLSKGITYPIESSPLKSVRIILPDPKKGSSKIVYRTLTYTSDHKVEEQAVKELKDPLGNEKEFDQESWVKDCIKQKLPEDFEEAQKVLDLPISRGYNLKNQPRLISKYSDNTLGSRPLTSENALSVTLETFLDLSKGLSYLHKAGIVHGDIKPENLLAPDNNSLGKLTDFGLAKLASGPPPQLFCATPLYLPPEYKNKTTTFKSDVYALGLSLMSELEDKVFPALLKRQAVSSSAGQSLVEQLATFSKYRTPKQYFKTEIQQYRNDGHFVRFMQKGTSQKKNYYYIFPTWNERDHLWSHLLHAIEPSLNPHEYDTLTSLYNLALQSIKKENIRPTAMDFHQQIKGVFDRVQLDYAREEATASSSLASLNSNSNTQLLQIEPSETFKRPLAGSGSESKTRKRFRLDSSSSPSSSSSM